MLCGDRGLREWSRSSTHRRPSRTGPTFPSTSAPDTGSRCPSGGRNRTKSISRRPSRSSRPIRCRTRRTGRACWLPASSCEMTARLRPVRRPRDRLLIPDRLRRDLRRVRAIGPGDIDVNRLDRGRADVADERKPGSVGRELREGVAFRDLRRGGGIRPVIGSPAYRSPVETYGITPLAAGPNGAGRRRC